MDKLSKEEWDKIVKKYGLMTLKDWKKWLNNLGKKNQGGVKDE